MMPSQCQRITQSNRKEFKSNSKKIPLNSITRIVVDEQLGVPALQAPVLSSQYYRCAFRPVDPHTETRSVQGHASVGGSKSASAITSTYIYTYKHKYKYRYNYKYK